MYVQQALLFNTNVHDCYKENSENHNELMVFSKSKSQDLLFMSCVHPAALLALVGAHWEVTDAITRTNRLSAIRTA